MARVLDGMYIGGGWTTKSQTFPDYNPSDGSIWANIPDASVEDTRGAIEAAHEAFPEWSEMAFSKRSHILIKAGEIFEKRREEIAEAVMAEGGGWFGKAMFETGYTAELFPAAAAANYGSIGEVLPSDYGKMSMAVRRADGRRVRDQPVELSPDPDRARFPVPDGRRQHDRAEAVRGHALYWAACSGAEIFEEAGLPKGVLNVVTCSRENVAAVGDELIENPLVKGISFTGSTAVGRQIARPRPAAHLKKCCVELGGKNSMIVCDDADMERAVQAANFGAFMHQGQICMSVERVIVHEDIYDKFRREVHPARQEACGRRNLQQGECAWAGYQRPRGRSSLKRHFDDAKAKGATVLAGGEIDGRFVSPTVFANVTPDMLLYQEESFGPVCSIFKVSSDEEAIRLANDSEYGLTAGVMSEDEGRALAIVNKLDTGNCHVNCSPVNDEPHVPFGGFKASGLGKHGGRWSMETFTETRWITLDRGGRPFPPVF